MAVLNVNEVLLGYYVFDLPSGEVLDLCSSTLIEIPADLSNLKPRYIERVITRPQGFKERVGFPSDSWCENHLAAQQMFPKKPRVQQLEDTLLETHSMASEIRSMQFAEEGMFDQLESLVDDCLAKA